MALEGCSALLYLTRPFHGQPTTLHMAQSERAVGGFPCCAHLPPLLPRMHTSVVHATRFW